MSVYFVTGKLGSGKTLIAVGKIQDKIVSGCKVASNLDLKLWNLPRVGRMAKSPRVMRIPDKPSINDLLIIGRGNDTYDENKNGLLVLDECGTWFNSRSWGDKSRQDVIDWFLHARKLGWDIIFLVQDISIVDKQARLALAEHVVYCRRLDRVTIPFIGQLFSFVTGNKIPLPKVHLGIVKYGDSQSAIVVDRWIYTGRDLYTAYDTKQAFSDSYPHDVFSYLPPYLTHGQFSVKRSFKNIMRLTRIYFRKLNRLFLMISFLALGVASGMFWYSHHHSGQTTTDASGRAGALPVASGKPLPRLFISSFSQFGGDFAYQLTDVKQNVYNPSDLIAQGYEITVFSPCRLVIRRGKYIQVVTCN
ncbi:hypothetical protein PUS30_000492 [Salmonella enterica]|nr:hypothetical protein [Salmonella enterica]EBH8630978.1 hypothetical protein [Salmonella enterica subsp. enterica serovar Oranienburg]EED4370769.1 hypothetical protein [Salmonella enterica subsp. enterica serovar Give]EEJ3665368.1 hypothetical protein [Salmonella enterica subsp. enterica]EAT1109214.1 hypothetical protein [Salmonella enterica]